MKLPATGYFVTVGIFRLFHTKTDIRVQFPEQTVAQMTGSDKFSLLSCKWTVVDDELHGNGRLRNFLERDRFRIFRRAERISDRNIRNSGNCHDRSDPGFFDFHFIQTVKFIKFADLYFLLFVRIMMVDEHHFLIDCDRSVVHFADTDPSHIFIIIDRTDQNLSWSFRIALRSRNVIDDRLKQRFHIFLFIGQIQNGNSGFSGCIDKRAVQLLVGCVQIHEKFQYFIDHFVRTCFRAVDLVDADDDRKIQLQRFAEYEFGLRHCALKCIDNEDDTVDHFQNTFHLAAEIGMSRCVDDVDLCSFVKNCGIFREDRDSAFSLNIVGIHDTFRNFLILAEYTALFEQFIDQCCLTVVDMGDDRNISDVFSFCLHNITLFLL
ncbi:putative uncharacterized protein [Lachnospiraceae bacterium CAG:215]|nr:putative uncharacterized protein [Lachnospiraceae bacterium CAG:215]